MKKNTVYPSDFGFQTSDKAKATVIITELKETAYFRSFPTNAYISDKFPQRRICRKSGNETELSEKGNFR
jgi:hypothetical protein